MVKDRRGKRDRIDLTAGRVFEVTPLVQRIVSENRIMPARGAYRLARLLKHLLDEFEIINGRRNALILAYDHKVEVEVEGQLQERNAVPDDKLAEFNAAWREIADQTIVIDGAPIPLSCFHMDGQPGPFNTQEIFVLDGLIAE